MRSDDLVPLLTPPPLDGIGYRQGVVRSFNLATGENVIDVGGTQLVDVACLNVTDAAGLLPGMIVGLLTWRSSWWLIGRVAVPGSDDFGDLTVRNNDGSGVKIWGNGLDIIPPPGTVPSAGRLFAQNIDGETWAELIPPRFKGGTGDNRIIISGGTDMGPGYFLVVTNGHADIRTAGDTYLRPGGNLFLNADGQIQLNSAANQVFITHQTTTASATCYLGTTGIVRRSTSARRYKHDIADLEVDPDTVLQLRPRTWRDKHEVEQDPDTTQRVPGFVAEELVDIGLDVFVTHNDNGEVESIAYDRLTAALIPLLRRQQQQIDALTARLDALEAHHAQ